MTPIDACLLQQLLGMDEERARALLAEAGIACEINRCIDPSPQGYSLACRARVLWAEVTGAGDGVILHVALPQEESSSVRNAKERHFGPKAEPIHN